MKKSVSLTLALLIFVSLGLNFDSVSAVEQGWFQIPILSSPRLRVEYFLQAAGVAPKIFEVLPRTFGFGSAPDISAVLDNTPKVREALLRSNKYREAVARRGPLSRIDVELVAAAEVKVVRLKQTSLDEWGALFQTRLEKDLREWNSSPLSLALKRLVPNYTSSILPGSMNGALTGLVVSLAPHHRSEAFKLPVEQRIAYVEKHLPDNLSEVGFKTEIHFPGLPNQTKEVVLEKVRASYVAEMQLLSILQFGLHQILHDANVIIEPSLRRRAQLTEGDLDVFIDKDLRARALKKLDDLTGKRLTPVCNAVIDRFLKSLEKETFTEVRTESQGSVTLIELPLSVAILRGYLGGDCSTSVSFAIPFSPFEHVFEILDHQGMAAGYISAVEVTTHSARTLYVHTINGARLSSSMVLLALSGILKLSQELGIENIVLPETENLNALINYTSIRSIIESVASSASVPIAYPDASIRSMIHKHAQIEGDYDKAESNKFARKLNVEKLASLVRSRSRLSTVDSASLPRASIKDLVKHLLGNQNLGNSTSLQTLLTSDLQKLYPWLLASLEKESLTVSDSLENLNQALLKTDPKSEIFALPEDAWAISRTLVKAKDFADSKYNELHFALVLQAAAKGDNKLLQTLLGFVYKVLPKYPSHFVALLRSDTGRSALLQYQVDSEQSGSGPLVDNIFRMKDLNQRNQALLALSEGIRSAELLTQLNGDESPEDWIKRVRQFYSVDKNRAPVWGPGYDGQTIVSDRIAREFLKKKPSALQAIEMMEALDAQPSELYLFAARTIRTADEVLRLVRLPADDDEVGSRNHRAFRDRMIKAKLGTLHFQDRSAEELAPLILDLNLPAFQMKLLGDLLTAAPDPVTAVETLNRAIAERASLNFMNPNGSPHAWIYEVAWSILFPRLQSKASPPSFEEVSRLASAFREDRSVSKTTGKFINANKGKNARMIFLAFLNAHVGQDTVPVPEIFNLLSESLVSLDLAIASKAQADKIIALVGRLPQPYGDISVRMVRNAISGKPKFSCAEAAAPY